MAKRETAGDPGLLIGDRLTIDDRCALVGLAARVAAASGEDAVTVAAVFAKQLQLLRAMRWSDASADYGFAALSAAVTEAAERHDHLRGRQPANSESVITRSGQFASFIAGERS